MGIKSALGEAQHSLFKLFPPRVLQIRQCAVPG